MTRTDRFQSRVAFTLALMLAITGLIGAVRVSALPASAQVVTNVVVSCDAPGADGTTTCYFSAPGAEQLAVPAGGFCSAIVSASGTFDGASYVSGSGDPSIAATFGTPVAAGGGATYTVTSGGVASAVGGSGVVCIDPPATTETQPVTDVVPAVEDTTVSDQPVTDDTVPVEEQESTDDGAGEGTDAGVTDTTDSTDSTDTTDTTGATDDVTGENDAEGDTGSDDTAGDPPASDKGDGQAGDGTGGTAGEAVVPANVIVDPETPDDPQPEPGEPVTVTIIAYHCATDPGAADPATAGCTLQSDVQYTAEDDSGALGTVSTDGSGSATFTSSLGARFIVTQASVVPGAVVRGDGIYEVLSLDGDITITFVNVEKDELGALQLIGAYCLTGGESGTTFTIFDESVFGTAASDDCGPYEDGLFTLTSSSLPGGSMVVRLDWNGVWTGYIPAGDYTVTAPDGSTSGAVLITADFTAIVISRTSVHEDQGTLTLELFRCEAGPEQVDVNPSGDTACAGASGVVTVSDDGENDASHTITLSPGQPYDLKLRPGRYFVTGPQGVTVPVDIAPNVTTVARVMTFTPAGGDGTGNPNPNPNPNPGGPGNNPPGDGTGNPIGQPDGGSATGGDGTGVGGSNGAYGSNSALSVTQLPNTGSGSSTSDYWWPVLLLALASGLALTGFRLRPQVARRKI